MRIDRIWGTLCASLLLAVGSPAATVWEKDGVSLSGSVRMVARDAATCEVTPAGQAPESYEATKANHGQPLHVWRLDYGAFNGSGKSLSHLTAHFGIETEWPPCTNWTGLGQYPGPIQWASSFETLQRTSGMQPGEEASATTYVLAIDGEQPRFRNWQVDFRFGEATPPNQLGSSAVAIPFRSPAPLVPKPLCDFDSRDKWFNCWYELASPADCYAWIGVSDWPGDPEWTGECIDGLASGTGSLIAKGWDPYTEEDRKRESTGVFRVGKKDGPWVDIRVDGWHEEGPYVDGRRHGRWIDYGVDKERLSDPLIRVFENGQQTDSWWLRKR